MNRAERIYRLHSLLKGRRSISLAHMLQELGISRATAVRDLAYMRDFMDAPIIYDRESNGYHYEIRGPEFELPGLWFNESELHALLASEQLLERVQPGLLSPYIGPLRGRIRKLLSQSGYRAETVTERIQLQPIAARAMDTKRFGAIATGVLEGRRLEIHYHGRQRDQVSSREIHPQRLLRYRDNWYLVAWCELARDLRIFSMDRVRHLKVLDDPADQVESELLNRFLDASFGIFSGVAKAWATLRFTPEASRWVADEIWHRDQIGQWLGGQYVLKIPYSDPRELMMDILKYGADAEVIEPVELRTMVANRLRRAAARYED